MSGGNTAGKRQPLDLKQKWFVTQYWAQQKPSLTRASFAVLVRLLDRQNTKTGRCDPSAVGLADETGFSERSIRSAFKELEERGVLKRSRRALRARNQFMIFSVDELRRNLHHSALKPRAGQRTGLNPASVPHAVHCRQNLQRPSPETIKETKKKKRNAENVIAPDLASGTSKPGASSDEIGLGEFERRVVKVFEKEGYGYEGLMSVPAEELELVYCRMVQGDLSFSAALGQLLSKYRSLSEQP